MILDNLTRAFKTQNWLAVATEFVIVIAGVVIGFQVNGWAEDRSDRSREALILCRLADDFDLIGQDVAEHLADARASVTAADALVEAAGRGMTPADLDTGLLPVAYALRITPAGSATYGQLVASGEMSLIRSEDLRAALTDFGEHLKRHERAEAGIIPIMVSARPLFEFGGLTSENIDALPEALRADVMERLVSRDFYFAMVTIRDLAGISLQWKITTAEKLAIVEAALTPVTPDCAEPAP
jgi:hypothetical protein